MGLSITIRARENWGKYSTGTAKSSGTPYAYSVTYEAYSAPLHKGPTGGAEKLWGASLLVLLLYVDSPHTVPFLPKYCRHQLYYYYYLDRRSLSIVG